MRRFFLVFALTLIAGASFTAAAFAKEGGVELSSIPPGGIGPGDPWTPQLTLIDNEGRLPANPKPGIRITNLDTGRTIDYDATPTKNPAVYTVQVVFPTPGQWDYAAYDGVTDRLYEFPATTVLAPKATLTATPKPVTTSSESSFPVWPLVGGIGAAALLAGATILIIRNRRFAH
jgi:hypothetical protein